MKIVNQNNTNHSIKIIPRFYPLDNIEIHLFNELENETFIVDCSYTIMDGFLEVNFDFDFLNKDRLSFEVKENNVILYYGKIYSTIEETQNYKQSLDLYEY